MMAARGDSVATMADLEAGRGGAGGEEQVVPVQHVRRLTTTLVDILRHVAASGQQPREQQVGGCVRGWVGTRQYLIGRGVAAAAPCRRLPRQGKVPVSQRRLHRLLDLLTAHPPIPPALPLPCCPCRMGETLRLCLLRVRACWTTPASCHTVMTSSA
jgi:hypothetical protein